MIVESTSAYEKLEKRFRRLSVLGETVGWLDWDQHTFMPRGGAEARADQIAELELIRHELLTDPWLADRLDAAEAEIAALSDWQRRNLADMRRRWIHASAVPSDLHEAATRAGIVCETAWREARPANDFAAVAPPLANLVRLKREAAEARGAALGCAPYDALLDHYQPGLRAADFAPAFDALARFLPGFIDAVIDRQAQDPAPLVPPGPFPIAAQRALETELMGAVGFPFNAGRLDESAHPFTGGTPEDLRITTRYDESDFTASLLAVLHETGHALYERNLPPRWRRQPVGEAFGMAVHESQSILIERQACGSAEFYRFAAPAMRRAFDGDGPAWDAENLHRAALRVERSLIRVHADEVTYPAHILVRTEIERALIAGALTVRHLPDAWHEAMLRLVGVAPDSDSDGCLQDIHWHVGEIGYFPTYALGAIMAAQLFAAARDADPGIAPGIAKGDFGPLYAWLRPNVHDHGSALSLDELLTRATGRPLDPEAYFDHLRTRYAP